MEWKQFRMGFLRFFFKNNKILFLFEKPKKARFFWKKNKNTQVGCFFEKNGFFSTLPLGRFPGCRRTHLSNTSWNFLLTWPRHGRYDLCVQRLAPPLCIYEFRNNPPWNVVCVNVAKATASCKSRMWTFGLW